MFNLLKSQRADFRSIHGELFSRLRYAEGAFSSLPGRLAAVREEKKAEKEVIYWKLQEKSD